MVYRMLECAGERTDSSQRDRRLLHLLLLLDIALGLATLIRLCAGEGLVRSSLLGGLRLHSIRVRGDAARPMQRWWMYHAVEWVV